MTLPQSGNPISLLNIQLEYDDGKKVRRIWVLGGRLSPKLGTPEIVIKQ